MRYNIASALFSAASMITAHRTFVVDAAEMADAVDDHAMQFIVIFRMLLFTGAYRRDRDHDITIDGIVPVVIESDDISIIIIPRYSRFVLIFSSLTNIYPTRPLFA